MKIVYRTTPMTEVVDTAMAILREKSPVGSAGDAHPGLYRDSHMIFVDGRVVKDVNSWKPGQQINISNPVPYSRKIESGKFTVNVPGHVYEDTAQILQVRYGNSVRIAFVFMPVRFEGVAAWASFSALQRTGRRLSEKARQDWLVRQPALEIKAL